MGTWMAETCGTSFVYTDWFLYTCVHFLVLVLLLCLLWCLLYHDFALSAWNVLSPINRGAGPPILFVCPVHRLPLVSLSWNTMEFVKWNVISFIFLDFVFVFGATAPQWGSASSFTSFLDHTRRRTTVGRTPLDEWSARRRDLYLTTHNIHNKLPCPDGNRTHNLSRRAAADLRLRPRGHF